MFIERIMAKADWYSSYLLNVGCMVKTGAWQEIYYDDDEANFPLKPIISFHHVGVCL